MKVKNFNLAIGSQIFKSFSDESRIRIIHLISKNRQMCIADLELVLGFTQTKISRHLGYLKNSGLVGFAKIDQWAFYSLKAEVGEFVDIVLKYLERDPDLQKDQQNYQVLYSNRELAANKLAREISRKFK
jgi:ArsR family transcriptional regulator, arsenate/arsenite/antimonite-responsive transcriptional repressor